LFRLRFTKRSTVVCPRTFPANRTSAAARGADTSFARFAGACAPASKPGRTNSRDRLCKPTAEIGTPDRLILKSRDDFDSLDALDGGLASQDAGRGSTQELPIEPGRSFRCGLFARGAGVHVDFHAHRHFDNSRSLPGHSVLPSLARTPRRS
jgi:hypothetical protein